MIENFIYGCYKISIQIGKMNFARGIYGKFEIKGSRYRMQIFCSKAYEPSFAIG